MRDFSKDAIQATATPRPGRRLELWEIALVSVLPLGMLAAVIAAGTVRNRHVRADHAKLLEIRLGMSREEVMARLGPSWRTEKCRELPEWLDQINVLARADGEITECVGWRTRFDLLTYVRITCVDRDGRVVLVATEGT